MQHSFPTRHADYIRDVAYDFYGTRLATCSADHKIKIYEQNERHEWTHIETIDDEGHTSSVERIDWAHPEFGSILASCSTDLTVNIYVEEVDVATQKRKFKRKQQFTEAKHFVEDIKFAPHHLGLKLATCSSDGFVRIYEAVDVFDLAESWTLKEEFQVSSKDCYCISWNFSPFDPMQLVVGTQNDAQIWEYSKEYKRWQLACHLGEHGGSVYDIDWAPKMGRSHHLLATACKDQKVRIFKVKENLQPKPTEEKEEKVGEYITESVATLDQHGTAVWRVSWNVTGTVLASSGEDGSVKLWKTDSLGNYKCTLSVAASEASGGGVRQKEGVNIANG